jgi:predicted amidohydrolase YtcJ
MDHDARGAGRRCARFLERALAQAQAESPRFDHRFMLHHIGYHAAAQTARIAALGAHASVNPYYIHALADEYARVGLGPERASQITRCASLLRAGVRVSFHSDFMMAPPEPLLLAWCAANRITASGRVIAPEERLTLMQALRGITIDAAWALRLDHEIGSIAAGKRADFVVLQDDPFEFGVERLKDVRVAGTVFEGSPHMLARPLASLHGELAPDLASAAVSRRVARDAAPRYRMVGKSCCGNVPDCCEIGRQWAHWLSQHTRAGARL